MQPLCWLRVLAVYLSGLVKQVSASMHPVSLEAQELIVFFTRPDSLWMILHG